MKFGTLLGLGTLGLALVGIPLAAQVTTTYGGQVTLAMPAGPLSSTDWLDGKVGGGVGLHALIGFEGGHAIVPRFDYSYFKKNEDGVDRKVQTVPAGRRLQLLPLETGESWSLCGRRRGCRLVQIRTDRPRLFQQRYPHHRLWGRQRRLDVHAPPRCRTPVHLEPLQTRCHRFHPPGLYREAHGGCADHQRQLDRPALTCSSRQEGGAPGQPGWRPRFRSVTPQVERAGADQHVQLGAFPGAG